MKKQVLSGLYIYKLVLHEPANSQNEECKQFLHGLCSPPTGKTTLLQTVQIQLLSLRKERRLIIGLHCAVIGDTVEGGVHPEVKFGASSSKLAVFRNVVSQS